MKFFQSFINISNKRRFFSAALIRGRRLFEALRLFEARCLLEEICETFTTSNYVKLICH